MVCIGWTARTCRSSDEQEVFAFFVARGRDINMATLVSCDRETCGKIIDERSGVTRVRVDTSLMALMGNNDDQFAEGVHLDLCFDCGLELRHLIMLWLKTQPKPVQPIAPQLGQGD